MIRGMSRQIARRAPRVSLPECTFVTIQLENRRHIAAKLRRISLTGGLLDLAIYLDERLSVSLTLPIGSGIIHARAEMLFPMRSMTGYLQPFRFTAIREEQLHILDREVGELLKRAQASVIRQDLGANLPNFLLELL